MYVCRKCGDVIWSKHRHDMKMIANPITEVRRLQKLFDGALKDVRTFWSCMTCNHLKKQTSAEGVVGNKNLIGSMQGV